MNTLVLSKCPLRSNGSSNSVQNTFFEDRRLGRTALSVSSKKVFGRKSAGPVERMIGHETAGPVERIIGHESAGPVEKGLYV